MNLPDQLIFRQRYKGLLVLFALTLALKVIMLMGTEVVSNDGPTYLNVSKQFLDGNLGFRDAFRGGYYFYPALIAVLSRLLPGNTVDSLINAGQLLSMLFSILAIIPFYLLVEKIWSAHAAFWGGLIFCVAPGINKYSVDVMRDPGYICFYLTALCLGWMFMETHRFRFLLGALLSVGLAYLFRVEGFLLVPLVLLWCAGSFVRQGRLGNAMLRSLLVLAVIAGLAGGVAWYLRSDAGQASRYAEIAGGVGELASGEIFGYSPDLKEVLDNPALNLVGSAHKNDFFAIVKDHIRIIYFLGVVTLTATVTWTPFFLLALLGLVNSSRDKNQSWYLLGFMVAYLVLGYVYNLRRNFLEERYIYSVALVLYAYAGYAIARGLEKYAPRMAKKLIWALLIALVTVPATMQTFKDQRKWRSYPFKEAGLWLAAQPDIQQARVLANERKIPFYAGKYDNYSPISFNIEQIAGQGSSLAGYDYITIETGDDYKDKVVELDNFKIVKKVESDRYVAIVYKKIAH